MKKQKTFLNQTAGSKQQDQISEELGPMLEHGTKNEINAIATLLSEFLPAFFPELSFYEGGCYIERKCDKEMLLVSPDGSLRNKTLESMVEFGIEIKCPFPDKLYTTPVHYSVPTYYVPQILSEMKCLGVNKLLFLSYSKDSMAVHEAKFDHDLWDNISIEIEAVQESAPKTLRKTVSSIKDQIGNYCRTDVTLIAEIPSCVAKPCDHSSDETNQSRIYHTRLRNGENMVTEVKLKSIQRTFLRCIDLIEECQNICWETWTG